MSFFLLFVHEKDLQVYQTQSHSLDLSVSAVSELLMSFLS